jgi:hypothetical protein
MDIHQNARLTPRGREALAKTVLLQGVILNSAAAEFKVSAKTARKWVHRYQTQGVAGMGDRSSRPRHSPRATSPELTERVVELRRQQRPAYHIAHRSSGKDRRTHRRAGHRPSSNRGTRSYQSCSAGQQLLYHRLLEARVSSRASRSHNCGVQVREDSGDNTPGDTLYFGKSPLCTQDVETSRVHRRQSMEGKRRAVKPAPHTSVAIHKHIPFQLSLTTAGARIPNRPVPTQDKSACRK